MSRPRVLRRPAHLGHEGHGRGGGDGHQGRPDGTFTNELYVGTLENGGVGLAPYHDRDAEIDDEVKAKLDELKAGIIDGAIKVG